MRLFKRHLALCSNFVKLTMPLAAALSACAQAPVAAPEPATPGTSPTPITCTKLTMPAQALHQVFPAHAATGIVVRTTFVLTGDQLKVAFDVHSPSLNAKKVLGANEYPYMFDAVETFISVSSENGPHQPYFEFELSPYNQTFDVKIPGEGKPFENNIRVGTDHSVQMLSAVSPVHWQGEIMIPLRTLGWNGDPKTIFGNAFAVLGASQSRSYWSLSLPAQVKPNFHEPQFFKPIFGASAVSGTCAAPTQ